MMRIMKRLKAVYMFMRQFKQHGWMAMLFPPTSTKITRKFVDHDVAVVTAFQGLMEVLPALAPDLQNLAMYRKYVNGAWWRASTRVHACHTY